MERGIGAPRYLARPRRFGADSDNFRLFSRCEKRRWGPRILNLRSLPPRSSVGWRCGDGHPAWGEAAAAARLVRVVPPWARAAPPLVRGCFGGRSLGLDGRLWRLVPRTPIAPLSRSLRCVVGGRRVLSRRRSLQSLSVVAPSRRPSSPPSLRCGACGRCGAAVSASRRVVF